MKQFLKLGSINASSIHPEWTAPPLQAVQVDEPGLYGSDTTALVVGVDPLSAPYRLSTSQENKGIDTYLQVKGYDQYFCN